MNRLYQILLLIILLTIPNLTDHLLLRNILGFTLIFLIVEAISNKKNYVRLAILTLLVILLLEIIGPMLCNNRTYETFESAEKLIDEIEKATKNNKKKEDNNDGKQISENDTEILTTEEKKHKEGEPYTPAQAQRETYQIIETVKGLQDTLQALTPQLKQAKDTLNAYKSLELD